MQYYIIDHVPNENVEYYEVLKEFLCVNNIKDIEIKRNCLANDCAIKFHASLKPLEEEEASTLRYHNKVLIDEIKQQKKYNNKIYSKNSKLQKQIKEKEIMIERIKDDKKRLSGTIKKLNKMLKE